MADNKITMLGVLGVLKRIIAGLKRGITPRDVYASQELRAPRAKGGLGFNETGLLSLTRVINSDFSQYRVRITAKKVRSSTTVRDLYRAIWDLIPASHRAE